MSWSPADDYDDAGRYNPGRTRWRNYATTQLRQPYGQCAENCCGIGTRLCDDPEDHDNEEEDTLDD